MLGTGWLLMRQAQEALKQGRLEEAQHLLGQPALAGHRRAGELGQELGRALVARAERHLSNDDPLPAWNDLLRAEGIGETSGTVRLRRTLTQRGLAEVRDLLQAGQAVRAVEAAASLRERGVRQAELDSLEEAARELVRAGDLADRGDFAQALEHAERVRHRLPGLGSLHQFVGSLKDREARFGSLLHELHAAAQHGRWPEVLQVTDRVLALAPQHPEARRLRTKAWRSVEPPTVVNGPAPRQGTVDDGGTTSGPKYLLWVDGVGGYLVCLGNRVTLGQATPEARVDVPIFADVSRHHATLVRDGEGYVLEAVRKVEVNGRETTRALLQPDDRLTLGASCQLQFRQPVPVSATARLELASGHRLRLAVDAVFLMADTLVLGPGPQAHVLMDLRQPVVLFRTREGLAVRYPGTLTVNGRACRERGNIEPGDTIVGDDFSLALEELYV